VIFVIILIGVIFLFIPDGKWWCFLVYMVIIVYSLTGKFL